MAALFAMEAALRGQSRAKAPTGRRARFIPQASRGLAIAGMRRLPLIWLSLPPDGVAHHPIRPTHIYLAIGADPEDISVKG